MWGTVWSECINIHTAYPRTVVWKQDWYHCILTFPANKFVLFYVLSFKKCGILKSFVFFEGFKTSLACPSDKSGIEMKMSIEHSWNNADRGKQNTECWWNGTDRGKQNTECWWNGTDRGKQNIEYWSNGTDRGKQNIEY